MNDPTNTCQHCNQASIEGLEPKTQNGLAYAVRYCDRCEEYLDRWPDEDPRPERKILRWKMPAAFLETDPTRLHQKQLKEALKWAPGKKGLLLAGITRAGKTRTMMELVKRQLGYGRNVTYWPAVELCKKLSDSHTRKGEHAELMHKLKRCRILYIDDLGKEKLTANVEACLFDIIRDRCDWHRPLLITTNFSAMQLAGRFTEPETSIPMVERLQEYCQIVTFAERIPEEQPAQDELAI